VNNYRNPRASLVEEPPRYNHSPFVHVYLSNAASVVANTFLNIPFDVAVVNENGCFNFASSPFFRAPVAGRYVFTVNLGLFGVTNAAGLARVARYDSTGTVLKQIIRITGTGASAPTTLNLAGSGVLGADLGDMFYTQVFCTLNANFFGSNTGEWDTLQIYRLT
jgi:hypothetical protein